VHAENKPSEKTAAAANFFSYANTIQPFFSPVIQRAPAKETESPIDIAKYAKGDSLIKIRHELDSCQAAKLGKTSTITTQSKIDDQTPEILDQVMHRAAFCGVLSNYITLKPTSIARGHYNRYQHNRASDYLSTPADTGDSGGRFDSNEWHVAVKEYYEGIDSHFDSMGLAERREKIRTTGGFYDRKKDTVNVPSDANFGAALHEAVHRLSNPSFQNLYGHELNEGANQFFTDIILMDEGLQAGVVPEYREARDDISVIAQKVGLPLLANFYFKGSQPDHMKIMHKLGLTASETKIEFVSYERIRQAAKLTFFTYRPGIELAK